MKIGFYTPCHFGYIHNRRAGPLLGIAYIASYLQEQFGFQDFFVEVDAQRIIEQKPDIVAISVFSERYHLAIEGARKIKAHLDVPIIIGGPHISALPQTLDASMDIGVMGEGELAMAEIVKLMLAGQFKPENLEGISNLIYWNEERQLIQAAKQERIQNLDILPLPHREMMQTIWTPTGEHIHWEQGVYTSRGCPFTCSFCMYSQTANLVRYHSIDRVLEDIEDVVRHYPEQDNIIFYDDLFVTKKSRLKELSDGIRANKLHHKLSFGCMAKTSFFDEEFAMILRDMNIRVISFGFESGCDRVLHYLKDRFSSVEKNQKAIDLCHKYGIHVGGYFILGSTIETREEMAKTYWFIRQNLYQMPLVSTFPVLPLPGTALWNETKERGLIDEGFSNWEHFGYMNLDSEHYIHLNKHYTLQEFKQYYDETFRPLMERSPKVFDRTSKYHKIMKDYYPQLLSKIRDHFKAGSRLLEINRGDRPLTFALEELYQLQSVHWTDVDRVKDIDFDGVILTHTLEKFGFHSKIWDILTAMNCPIYIIFENIGHIGYLSSLLRGNFASQFQFEEIEHFQSHYYFTLKTVEQQLQKFGFKQIGLFRHALSDFTNDEPVIAQMVTFLNQYIQVNRYFKEARIFSYSYIAQPTQILKNSTQELTQLAAAVG